MEGWALHNAGKQGMNSPVEQAFTAAAQIEVSSILEMGASSSSPTEAVST